MKTTITLTARIDASKDLVLPTYAMIIEQDVFEGLQSVEFDWPFTEIGWLTMACCKDEMEASLGDVEVIDKTEDPRKS